MTESLFTVEDQEYTLTFNRKKIQQVENGLKVSIMAEIKNTGGAISLTLLQTLFTVGLAEISGEEGRNKQVHGKKAEEIYDEVLEANGYQDLSNVVLQKLYDDMGFMFR